MLSSDIIDTTRKYTINGVEIGGDLLKHLIGITSFHIAVSYASLSCADNNDDAIEHARIDLNYFRAMEVILMIIAQGGVKAG